MKIIIHYADGHFMYAPAHDDDDPNAIDVPDHTEELWRATLAAYAVIQRQLCELDSAEPDLRTALDGVAAAAKLSGGAVDLAAAVSDEEQGHSPSRPITAAELRLAIITFLHSRASTSTFSTAWLARHFNVSELAIGLASADPRRDDGIRIRVRRFADAYVLYGLKER